MKSSPAQRTDIYNCSTSKGKATPVPCDRHPDERGTGFPQFIPNVCRLDQKVPRGQSSALFPVLLRRSSTEKKLKVSKLRRFKINKVF